MGDLTFRVLGPFVVLEDGRPIELSSRKQRALLALLALRAGQVLSVDRLVDDLWGERPPATARHALQVHVSSLRKLLGPTTVATERPGYVLHASADACDAHRFEALAAAGRRLLRSGDPEAAADALAEALALWRGPALDDLLAEPFAPHEATRLEELRIATTEDRISVDLELGRHAELVGELESLVTRHPLRERLWGLLMLASYRAGRQVEALQAFATVRDHLRDELGLDPGPELRQLEAAILRQDASLAAPPPLAAAAPRRATPAPAAAAHAAPESRRVATVLVASLVGFDEVAGRLDPEDLRALLDRSLAHVTEVLARYGGAVEEVSGGQVTAILGAPVAHEDDAERGVRAALELTEAAEQLLGLRLGVGVSTGEVLFAPPGPHEKRRLTVLGEVVNEARRLAARAGRAVLVGPATLAATRSVIEYHDVDGTAFAVRALSAVPQARRLGHTPFVGRDAELDQLRRTWSRTVAERKPALVSILGEPGVGKSRQLAEFQRTIGDEGVIVTGRCLPYGESLSYAPIADVVRELAGATADDSPSAARAKVGAFVRATVQREAGAAEIERHLALLTGLDDEVDRAAGIVDERTLHTSTRRLLEAAALAQPLCVVIEDVHWADDALLDLVHAVARRARGAPLLLLTLARPELVERREDWGGGVGGFSSILLEPLDHASTSALVKELASAHGLPEAVLADITAKSGGNPLFAEELVATVAEGEAGSGVPASLSSLLLARLDALPQDQQLALRRASVIGMTFWPGALAALGDHSEPDLADVLADLEHRDLLRAEPRSMLAGESAYSFKHVLIRDAAYGSLPRQERQRLHHATTTWLSVVAGDRRSEFSDQLAHHAMLAGEPERALEFLAEAVDRSRRAASHRREAALLAEALTIAEDLGWSDRVAELHAQRGLALSRLALWQEARTELETAIAGLPAATPEDLLRRAEVHNDLSVVCFWLLDSVSVGEHARTALDLATKVGSRRVELEARAQLTFVHSALGDVDRVLADGRGLIADAAEWGMTPPYERLGTFSLQLYLTGDSSSAKDLAHNAVRTGREVGDTHGVLWSMPHAGLAAAAAGNYDEALRVFREARSFGEEYELLAGLPRCIAMSAGFRMDLFDFAGAEEVQQEARDLGRVHFNPTAVSAGIDLLLNFTRRGDVGRAERELDEVAAGVAGGSGWHGWLWGLRFTQLRAELALAKGDIEQAHDLARESIEKSSSKRRAKYEAYAHRTLGQALLARGDKEAALRELRAAVTIAEQLKNPALHLLTAATLVSAEPDDDVLSAARDSVQRVLGKLTDPGMVERFTAAEAVRALVP